MKSVKIQVPKGYEIDEKNSTFEEIKFKPINNLFEFLDLNLPSKTLWATCNVGAEKPEERGKLLSFDEVFSEYELPTSDQIEELIKFCDWKYVNYKGVNGYLVIGTNGNSIFLPAAGYRDVTFLCGVSGSGNYWSRTLGTNDLVGAYSLYFNSNDVVCYNGSRYYGRSVRCVKNN